MLVVTNNNQPSDQSPPPPREKDVEETSPAGLVDVIDDAEDDDERRHLNTIVTATTPTTTITNSSSLVEVLPDNSSSSPVDMSTTTTPVELNKKNNNNGDAIIINSESMTHSQVSNNDDENINNTSNGDIERQAQVPLSTWLIPELAKVAETLQLLRARLPNSSAPQAWQLEDAICNALEATRRVADQYIINEDAYGTGVSPSDNSSLMDAFMNDPHHNPNSEYQTLGQFANHRSRSDQPDYQKLAIMNGLAPPDESHYEASMIATLSDEDEYDRLAYEFPIHPSMRKRAHHMSRQPPPMTDDDETTAGTNNRQRRLLDQLPPQPKLVDVAVGRCDGSVLTNDKACNTYRVLNVSRPVQAVELPPAKFSKHVQTHLLVTDKCVGDDEDDLRSFDAEVQTDDVNVKQPGLTEDSWAQTEDKFTENVSVYANMLRDFGQSVSTQTTVDQMPIRYVPSPSPLTVETAHKMHLPMQISPRSLSPTSSVVITSSQPPLGVRASTSRRLSSASNSSGGGSLRSPSSTSTPIVSSNGCYQLFVRIDQNNRGSTANLMPSCHSNNNQNHTKQPQIASASVSSVNNNNHGRLLSTSSPSDASVTPSMSGGMTTAVIGGHHLMSDVMMMMTNSAILSPMDSGTSNTSAFLPSSITSSTMSPPTSDSQATSSATNDHSLSDDRGSSPRSWQSPVHISGPNETSPVIQPVQPRNRRASANLQVAPFRSGQLAAAADKAAFKSLIKISEGSPPEIRQTNTTQLAGSSSSNNNNNSKMTSGQIGSNGGSGGGGGHYQQNNPTVPKQITKIIHRLQRDPTIRAWCSVDNLLRQNAASQDNVNGNGSGQQDLPERAISPPPLFREFGDLTASVNDSGVVHEMAVDCDHITAINNNSKSGLHHWRNANQTVVLPPPKTKQLSMNDVSDSNDIPVLRNPFLKASKQRNNGSQQQIHNKGTLEDNVVCLARRTLVSIGSSEESDYSVAEVPFEKTHRNKNHTKHHHMTPRRSNYPTFSSSSGLHGGGGRGGSGQFDAASAAANKALAGGSVFSRLSNFLHLGNSKTKRTLQISC